MRRKHPTQEDYGEADLARAFSACLHVADSLGADLMTHMTVVGGLAPYLLIPPAALPREARHVGTLDLDLGLTLSSDPELGLFERIAERLRSCGFSAERNETGREQLRWRWAASQAAQVWIDLIPDAELAGVTPWLPEIRLARIGRVAVDARGRTLDGREVSTRIWVCSAAAFLVLKAIAYRRRRERKDAHDLYFVLRYYPGSLLEEVGTVARDPAGRVLLEVLTDSFADHDAVGCRAVAEFIAGRPEDEIQADVVGAAQRILRPLHLS
jgi:hypothetical protein